MSSEREQALRIMKDYMKDDEAWIFDDESLTNELEAAHQRGFDEAKEMAAQVADGEDEEIMAARIRALDLKKELK